MSKDAESGWFSVKFNVYQAIAIDLKIPKERRWEGLDKRHPLLDQTKLAASFKKKRGRRAGL